MKIIEKVKGTAAAARLAAGKLGGVVKGLPIVKPTLAAPATIGAIIRKALEALKRDPVGLLTVLTALAMLVVVIFFS